MVPAVQMGRGSASRSLRNGLAEGDPFDRGSSPASHSTIVAWLKTDGRCNCVFAVRLGRGGAQSSDFNATPAACHGTQVCGGGDWKTAGALTNLVMERTAGHNARFERVAPV